LIVTSTFTGILASIAKEALEHAEVLYGQKVVSIASNTTPSGPRSIEVSTSIGTLHTFDGVVVTTPLGWLKRNQSAFHPALPTRIAEAIDSMHVGHLEKV
jgi:Flavin containing amine oxidoreductase